MADTFGVDIHVTEERLELAVHVPSDIDSGWTDPEAFQRLVERVVWERLERETVLRAVAAGTPPGATVSLGRVTLDPDGTVVGASLSPPDPPETPDDTDGPSELDEPGETEPSGSDAP